MILSGWCFPTQCCGGLGASPALEQPKPAPMGRDGKHLRATYSYRNMMPSYCSLLCRLAVLPSRWLTCPSSVFLLCFPALHSYPLRLSSWRPALASFLSYTILPFRPPSRYVVPCATHPPALSLQVQYGPATIAVDSELLSLCHRRSPPDPLLSSDSPTANLFSRPPSSSPCGRSASLCWATRFSPIYPVTLTP